MTIANKIFYNEASSAKLGWTPRWFGLDAFNDELLRKISKFQSDHNLVADGLVGPITFRRLYTSVEANLELMRPSTSNTTIVCNNKQIEIAWDKVVTFQEAEGALALPSSCYREYMFERKPHMLVTHWDAALSAKSCKSILERRGLSTHFVIDNDGTIYQLVDTNHVAWHAGELNKVSIGIDFSNAFYLKYQKVYRKRGLGNRPIVSSNIHDHNLGEHLGYYEIQLEAYKALVKSLCDHYAIPLECPLDSNGSLVTKVYSRAQRGSFRGVVCHYHLSKKKIDCAGLEIDRLLSEIKTI